MQKHARLEMYDPTNETNGMIEPPLRWRLVESDEKGAIKKTDVEQRKSADEFDIIAVLDYLSAEWGWRCVSSDGMYTALLVRDVAVES